MFPWTNCLLLKHKDLSSDPQPHIKAGAAVCTCTTNAGMQTAALWGLTWLHNLAKAASSAMVSDSASKNKVESKEEHTSCQSLVSQVASMGISTYIHVYMGIQNTHTHTHIRKKYDMQSTGRSWVWDQPWIASSRPVWVTGWAPILRKQNTKVLSSPSLMFFCGYYFISIN